MPAPGVLGNDGSGSLKAALWAGPSHAASFTLNSNGSFRYVPHDGYFGWDSFQYVNYVTGGPCSYGATVLIKPAFKVRAQNDAFATPVNTTLHVGNSGGQIAICSMVGKCGVLNNEILLNDAVTVQGGVHLGAADGKLRSFGRNVAHKTEHGTVTLVSDGSFTYVPDAGFVGTDEFGYGIPIINNFLQLTPYHVVQPNAGGTNITYDYAKVDIQVSIPPPPTVAKGVDDVVVATEDTVTQINPSTLLANDTGGAAFITMVQQANFGTQTLSTSHGSITATYSDFIPGFPSLRVVNLTYTPSPNFSGVDSFTYHVASGYNNGWNTTNFPARVYLYVASVADTPVAAVDVPTMFENAPRTFNVALNDTDADGDLDPTSVVKDTDPCEHQNPIPNCTPTIWNLFLRGTWVVNGDGTVTYTPTPDFVGTALFPYRISDTTGRHAWSRVAVQVLNNLPPDLFVNDWCNEGVPFIICLTEDDRYLNEGGTAELNGSLKDPERQSGALVVDWGDGSTTSVDYPCDGEAGCPFSMNPTYSSICVGLSCADLYFHLEHTYADDPAAANNQYSISATITEKHGNQDHVVTEAQVNNVDPTLSVAGDCPLCIGGSTLNPTLGSPAVIAGSVIDPGSDGGTLTIDWGDGQPVTTVGLGCGSTDLCPTPSLQSGSCPGLFPGPSCGHFSESHTYGAPGQYAIAVTVTDDDGGTDSQSVSATVTRPGPTPFSDISGSTFEDDITWMWQVGITSGCSATLYCPNAPVTRAQMASFLARALNLPNTATDYFTDDETSSHEDNINRVAAAGITTGCGPGLYCPNANVTREQMASFLVRALGLTVGADIDYFTDDDSSSHEANINRLRHAGLTTGCTATTFCPKANVTRGQMAAFLHRALE